MRTLATQPAQANPLDDPDADGQSNLAEFTFGTDPLSGNTAAGLPLTPLAINPDGTTTVEVLLAAGRPTGVQIDLEVSADLQTWIRPWWSRTSIAAQPGV